MWQPVDSWINMVESKTLPEGGTLMSQCSECVEHSQWLQRVIQNELDIYIQANGKPMTQEQRLGMQVLSAAAKLPEVAWVQTHSLEGMLNRLVYVVLRALKGDELARSKKRHYRDHGRSTAEWMRVGTRGLFVDTTRDLPYEDEEEVEEEDEDYDDEGEV